MVVSRFRALALGVLLFGGLPEAQGTRLPILALYNAVATTGIAFTWGYNNGWSKGSPLVAIGANSSATLTLSAFLFFPRFMSGDFEKAFLDPIGIVVATLPLALVGWALGRLSGYMRSFGAAPDDKPKNQTSDVSLTPVSGNVIEKSYTVGDIRKLIKKEIKRLRSEHGEFGKHGGTEKKTKQLKFHKIYQQSGSKDVGLQKEVKKEKEQEEKPLEKSYTASDLRGLVQQELKKQPSEYTVFGEKEKDEKDKKGKKLTLDIPEKSKKNRKKQRLSLPIGQTPLVVDEDAPIEYITVVSPRDNKRDSNFSDEDGE
jgi:hypothetical protein